MKAEKDDLAPTITKLKELTYEIKIGQAMTKDVITVPPHTTMCELREVLKANRISGTPVVENGQIIGIISLEDLINAMGVCGPISTKKNGEDISKIQEKNMASVRENMNMTTVQENMTLNPETLYADEPLASAISKFNKFHYGRFPIINRQEDLVGIITQSNIIHAVLQHLEIAYYREEIHDQSSGHVLEDIIADEVKLILRYHVNAEDFDHAGEASSRLKKTLHSLGFHPQTIRRVAIASYEAEINLVLWGKGGELQVEVQPSQIKLETFDTGPGIENIEQAMQPGYSSAPEWVQAMGFGAGMGLPNIKACSDDLKLESTFGEGTHLKAIIYINEI
ncbi:MAG: hypothetical protein B6I38_07500 [Anaerolineaceae bacterium 4572_5.1]|nr:MAG: hypothetical protein B6I38_07500 [Anaerolineaceae bacterium 4572_5.1]